MSIKLRSVDEIMKDMIASLEKDVFTGPFEPPPIEGLSEVLKTWASGDADMLDAIKYEISALPEKIEDEVLEPDFMKELKEV